MKSQVGASEWYLAQIVSIYPTNVKVIMDTPLRDPETDEEIYVVTFNHNDPDILPPEEGKPDQGNVCWIRNIRRNPHGWRAYEARFLRPSK